MPQNQRLGRSRPAFSRFTLDLEPAKQPPPSTSQLVLVGPAQRRETVTSWASSLGQVTILYTQLEDARSELQGTATYGAK